MKIYDKYFGGIPVLFRISSVAASTSKSWADLPKVFSISFSDNACQLTLSFMGLGLNLNSCKLR
jgi:hypothetical protein